MRVGALPASQRPPASRSTTHGGRTSTGIDAVAWAVQGAELGAGEILLNSMDADGVTKGFDTEMIDAVRRRVRVPLIASGGAGSPQDFVTAANHGADGVLAASVFHYGSDDHRCGQECAARRRPSGPLKAGGD